MAVLALVTVGCGRADGQESSQRPAAKDTCAEAVLDTARPALDRRLVNFSPTLLGVETLYGNDVARVRVVSGGYLDDVLEAYDDLVPVGTAVIRDTEAELLATDLLGVPVRVAVWRESGETPPCDAHALIATGLTDSQFATEIALLR